MNCRLINFCFLFFCALTTNPQSPSRIKIASIGASITAGSGLKNPQTDSYPGQLQTKLGDKYEVRNYGQGGCTMLRKGDLPYWNTTKYREALEFNADIVTIDLGGNDSKLVNRVFLNEYKKDCRDMIQSFAATPSHPRIILLLPVVSFVTDTNGIWDPVISNKIIPLLKEVAFEENVEIANIHSLLIDKPQMMPDKIHPDLAGTSAIAKSLYEVISFEGDTAYNIFPKIPFIQTLSSFHGYQCADFTFNKRECKVVRPKIPAKGHPWIWRARFWGHEPQTDIALLERGFHVVYCDAAELLGNQESINLWNGFYTILNRAGLSKKAVMEGMSRGAVYVFNWAAVNTDKVAGVYVDNPLLDIPSWAVGLMKTPPVNNEMFTAFKNDYHLTSDEQIRSFKGSPVNKVNAIAQGRYPILILCADEDEAVSPADNTLLFEKKIKELKGNITVIHKPGFKHHPHSLPDPTPIVDFIMKSVGK